MAAWDRFDICFAHQALENDWNVGGMLHERPSNRRRRESTGVQLHRMRFHAGIAGGCFGALEENHREIYVNALIKFGLAREVRPDDEILDWVREYFVPEFVAEHFPQLGKIA